MPEPGPKNLADVSELISFFQTETESVAGQVESDEFVLIENPPEARSPVSQPHLDSDNDCACE